jgi:hypothetical protein
VGRYAQFAAAVIERLEAHCIAGGVLEGVQLSVIPTTKIDGVKDFPSLRLFVAELTETRFATFKKHGVLELNFLVSTAKSLGLPAHLVMLEKVMDALETHPDSQLADTTFGGLVREPVELRFGDAGASDIGMHTQLYLVANLPRFQGGQRRLLHAG